MAASWTLSSDGSGAAAGPPARTDDIVVLNGHTITVNNKNDNGSAGVSASATYTVGAFAGAGTTRFYQNGLVTVDGGGILDIVQAAGAMFEDTVYVYGTISTASSNIDFINAGYMHVYSGGAVDVGDDFILIDNSETILDDVGLSSDDIYMDGTNSFLCGDGSLEIGGAIQEFNGADVNQQVCSTFTITCPDGDCCDEGTTVTSCTGNGDDGSFGGGGSFTLPVELISFTLKNEGNSVILEWSTASELNNDFFTVERSSDGKNFSRLGQVKGMGTVSHLTDYSFIDKNNYSEINFYRLSQTDFDGTSEMLGIKSVRARLNGGPNYTIYPNPAQDVISITSPSGRVKSLNILDFSGKSVLKLSQDQIEVEINISSVKSGVYLLQWTDFQDAMYSRRLSIK